MWLPWLFLPPNVILKQEQRGHEKLFRAEKEVVSILSPQWGVLLPYYYGETTCDGEKAHVFSEAKGTQLFKLEGEELELAFVKLEKAYETMSQYLVIHGDPAPEHVFIHEHGAMMIDWGWSEIAKNVDEARQQNILDLQQVRFMMKSNTSVLV